MEKIRLVKGTVAPIDHANIDTDIIIPKQYLKSIKRTGLGPFIFDDWRYLDPGDLTIDPNTRRKNPEFILNKPAYQNATVLLARENFGCGSSREHAAWALMEYGFRAVIAPSFSEIFYQNAIDNGMLPIRLEKEIVDRFFQLAFEHPKLVIEIDLSKQTIDYSDNADHKVNFDIDPNIKNRLEEGLDPIALTLKASDAIDAYEAKRREQLPWLFQPLNLDKS